MIDVSENLQEISLFEFQGEFENIELFNGNFDKKSLRLNFPTFYLQGKKKFKEYTLCEVDDDNNINITAYVSEIILFDSPKRFILNLDRTKKF